MTKEKPPFQRHYGSEVEYSFTDHNASIGHSPLTSKGGIIPPSIPHYGNFVVTGGKLHQDVGLIEYATPECKTLDELVLHELVGEQLALEVAAQFPDINTLHKRAVDTKGEYTYGIHENYSTEVDIWSKDLSASTQTQILATHFATRTIFTGSGFYNRKKGYEIGQKMRDITVEKGTQATSNKALINERAEHHDLSDTSHRLHVVCGDANISPWAIRMKFGTTSLVLRLIEQGQFDNGWLLEDPLTAAKTVGGKVENLSKLFKTNEGKMATATDLQRSFFESCVELSKRVKLPDDELKVLEEWGVVLDALDEYARSGEEREALFQVDWFIRMKSIAQGVKRTGSHFPRDMVKFDAGYDLLPNGVGYGLRTKGRIFSSHSPTGDDLERARTTAPSGRAALRGELVRIMDKMPYHLPIAGLDWAKILTGPKGEDSVYLPLNGDYSPKQIDGFISYILRMR